jgi:hypothetical protein
MKAVTSLPQASKGTTTLGARIGLAQHVANWNGASHALPVEAPLAGRSNNHTALMRVPTLPMIR